MKRLVIENWTELLSLQEMLEVIPRQMEFEGTKPSAISNKVRRDILNKIRQILEIKT